MIRKVIGVIGFCVGAWVGYNYSLDICDSFGFDTESYWSEQGEMFLQIVLTLISGGVCGVGAYFLANLFTRFD
jgi:hypothetical protein